MYVSHCLKALASSHSTSMMKEYQSELTVMLLSRWTEVFIFGKIVDFSILLIIFIQILTVLNWANYNTATQTCRLNSYDTVSGGTDVCQIMCIERAQFLNYRLFKVEIL